MFDIGFTELVLVSVIGLLVLGPQRLPKVVAEIGKWVGRARRTATQLRRQLEREIELNDIQPPPRPPTPPSPPTASPAATAPPPSAELAGEEQPLAPSSSTEPAGAEPPPTVKPVEVEAQIPEAEPAHRSHPT